MKRNVTYKTKKKNVNLYVLSDFHLGAKGFAEDKLKERIEAISKDKDAVVVINGDFADFIRAGDPRFDMGDINMKYLDIQHQYMGIRKILKPIKDKIVLLTMGNHDYSVKKYYGFNVVEMLADDLDCDYTEDVCILNIEMKNKTYRIFVTHGATGAGTLGGAIRWLMKRVNAMEVAPDIALMGHVHRLDVVLNTRWTDEFNTLVKYIGITGSYYDSYSYESGNYATMKAYPPLPIGCLMFELSRDGNIVDHKIIENDN